ncbi:MAG TPA: xanthine dehydrogenase family protein molybdopterin-binding subunit [Pirellulales bacterium]|jgi:xanthine dehydrogenase YagR molybdenum-binding subunit|nr:xanthine dehydrogenase family protein molybdopterin-binding subunit [Pirellulales bacterium]
MIAYSWPKFGEASVIGKEHDRLDGLEKATGAAKYTYDINLKGMLFAKILGCPHAHCKIKSIDTASAEKMRGVHAVIAIKKQGEEVRWQGDEIAVVAAETEAAAAEALKLIDVDYELLDVFVQDEDLAAAEDAKRTQSLGEDIKVDVQPDENVDEDEFNVGELERQFKEAAAVVEGYYGIPVITHMCLEPHGSTCYWDGDKLIAYLSTQNVSGTAAQFATPLDITAGDVTVKCDFVGGGFGSKFAADSWGIKCAELAKKTGRPVKLMLDRDQELKVAGNRPSGFIKVRIGADKEGLVTCWDSVHWGTAGAKHGGVNKQVIPYVMVPKNYRRKQVSIFTDAGQDRAWRAPNHPQACAITQTALDDIAAKLGLDSYDVFMKNLVNATPKKGNASMAETYRQQMELAAKLIDWKAKWHAHGKGQAKGDVVTGLGMALHTWGGGPFKGNCLVKVHPDGAVEAYLGSQDLGTGTRTVIAAVIAETFGLPLSAVKVNIGSSAYPEANPSGGSITVGSVSETSRRASQEALDKIFELTAKKLEVEADTLEAREGRIQVQGDAKKGLTWQQACRLLGMNALEITGRFDPATVKDSPLSSSQVGGVQMAEVAVDRRTGVVKMKKFVAVQDMGLVINPKTAKSQMYGAVIMGIAYALFEERIMDAKTGAFLNAELSDYKLPRLGDVGDIIVEPWQPESEYKRGVVGLGEPPVISPGAAISNAVCNALGVRVPVLPLTPKRVLDAIKKGGNA